MLIENLEVSSIDKELINDMRNLTKEVWSDPGSDLVEKWIKLSQRVVIAKEKDELIGFALGSKISSNSVYLISSMVSKSFQNNKLGFLMNKALVKELISVKDILFRPFYLVFRTTNPRLYEKTYNNTKTSPDFKGERKPSKEEIFIFNKIRKLIANNKKFDENYFLIFNANQDYPQLNYEYRAVPWSNSKEINTFFEEKLGFKEKVGNAFIVVSTIQGFKKLIYVLS